MSHVFPRHTQLNNPVAVSGQGCYLYDQNGKTYLDGSGGAAVSCLGHGDPEVTEAIKNQLDRVAFAHTGFFTSEPAEALASLLIKYAPGDLDRVFLVSGGSEAVESCIKLARQYYLEKGEESKTRIIARRQSYHGNTLGALAASGSRARRAPYVPLMVETEHIDPCYSYRGMYEGESEREYGLRAASALERKILKIGPKNIMAFIAEPVVGASLGAVASVPGYFRRVREICDEYDILLILDEVMCGMGRTGSLYACEQDGIAPDIMSIAKGLGGGYQPVGAMLCTDKIYEAIKCGSGFFQHGHTYLGHPVACTAGLAVVSALIQRDLISRCMEQGDILQRVLEERFASHPHVGDIRGRGLFRGLEFVQNKQTKAPFEPDLKIYSRLKQAALAAGLVCYPAGGTVDGKRGDHVLIAPPFIISEDQIEELVDKLSLAVDAVLS